MSKFIVLVPDGMADEPVDMLGGKTPLEAAHTPWMDQLVKKGISGLVQTIPDNYPPGSDIGNLALMGYDPAQCFTGRAPLEAANMNIILAANEMAFRCNVVTSFDGNMTDYSAGHISSEEAAILIKDLDKALGSSTIRFYPGKSYRHLMVLTTDEIEGFSKVNTKPPHDILNQPIEGFLPQGTHAKVLLTLMEKSKTVFANHPVNQARMAKGLLPVTMIWLWGQGKKPQLPLLKDKFGITGSVISAVDLVNGIGRLAGLAVIDVPGANGYYDTNYVGKVEYALTSLKQHDFVYIHIEAPDEAGHNGDAKAKKECIEKIDALVVKRLIDFMTTNSDVRLLISPDHPTPVAKRTHTRSAVPFVMAGQGIVTNGLTALGETQAQHKGVLFDSGAALLTAFFKK